MNYCVILHGHISFFDVFEDAFELMDEYQGMLFNMWGLVK